MATEIYSQAIYTFSLSLPLFLRLVLQKKKEKNKK